MCYGGDNGLLSVKDEGRVVVGDSAPVASDGASLRTSQP